MTMMTKQAGALAILGGPAVAKRQWPTWPVWDDTERTALNQVLESGKWWYGEKVKKFEQDYAAFHNVRYGVTCTNGTSAIEMGLRAAGVVPGSEVIVPPYTFIATASAVALIGGIPIFADIDPETLCLDPQDVAKKITKRTRAIIPVHVGGRFADMESLAAIADEKKLAIVEDAAHAWGSLLRGKGPGTIGRCATFSFQISKNITAGEGGILLTNDSELAELCQSFTHCGRKNGSAWYEHEYLATNLRMTEFQAAILLAQLSRLESQIRRREQSAKILDHRLAGLPGIHLLAPDHKMTRRSYHMYIFRIDSEILGISRDRFIEALNAEGVPAHAGWRQPLYANPAFQNCNQGPVHGIKAPLFGEGADYTNVHCPVTEEVCRDAVWLGQSLLLADEASVGAIAAAIEKIVAHADELK